MITVEKAKNSLLENKTTFDTAIVPFMKATGKVLKETVVADRDFPPFHRVAMDGIAINYRFFEYGVRDFKIEGIQPAGSPQETLENAAHCYEVMTGASLPNNTDTVIRYEDVVLNNGMATVTVNTIKEGQNVHHQGTDKKQGDLLIKKNAIITAAEIGVLATVGKATVKVSQPPKVLVISTGNELVEVNQSPLSHQIRRSNVYSLVALLEKINVPCETIHLVDEKKELKEKIQSFLETYDVLLCSGAVSKGKFDFLPEVFDALCVKKLFHKVSQRPGKPFWAGVTDNCTVFAFPGNPVSTYVNCLVYFYPWYYASLGSVPKIKTAILTEEVTFKPELTYFLQVKLSSKDGQLFATPIKGNGSGDLANLVHADGFIELPKTNETLYTKGNVYPIHIYRENNFQNQ